MTNTIGTLNLLQSVVDHGLELEKFDTAGTSEEYGNVRELVRDHHDFDDHPDHAQDPRQSPDQGTDLPPARHGEGSLGEHLQARGLVPSLRFGGREKTATAGREPGRRYVMG